MKIIKWFKGLFSKKVVEDIEDIEEEAEWHVILRDSGYKKVNVIKAIRKCTGWGLKEAKEATDNTPTSFGPYSLRNATILWEDLKTAGADVGDGVVFCDHVDDELEGFTLDGRTRGLTTIGDLIKEQMGEG
jgi:hypothetical protein